MYYMSNILTSGVHAHVFSQVNPWRWTGSPWLFPGSIPAAGWSWSGSGYSCPCPLASESLCSGMEVRLGSLVIHWLCFYDKVVSVWPCVCSPAGMRVYVRLAPHLRGRVGGLCGNFDGDAENDFTTRQGIMESTPELFGNSWKISPSCPDVPDQDLRDPCVVSTRKLGEI